jgi:hypothetical protein
MLLGSPQWHAWLKYYETADPAHATVMVIQREKGRRDWSEPSPWPPGTIFFRRSVAREFIQRMRHRSLIAP